MLLFHYLNTKIMGFSEALYFSFWRIIAMIKKHENLRQTATPEGAFASLTAKKAARTTTKNLAIFLKNTKR